MTCCRISKFLVWILACALFDVGCGFNRGSVDPQADASQPNIQIPKNAAFGLFGNISTSDGDPNNFLMLGDDATFSYNNARGTVNWVTWKTTRSDLGEAVQRPDFRPDPRLPPVMKHIVSTDYSGSGYDRGHMIPAADRFGSPEAYSETFLMTNIVPQTSDLNQYPWRQLESYVRGQVRRGWNAYQIAGAYGEADILKGRVVVPGSCWKVIVFIRSGRAAEIDHKTRIIAVDMPNIDGIESQSWRRYLTNIRSIETKTGYNFFAALPANLQESLETRTELMFR